jgi:hypothetical protein
MLHLVVEIYTSRNHSLYKDKRANRATSERTFRWCFLRLVFMSHKVTTFVVMTSNSTTYATVKTQSRDAMTSRSLSRLQCHGMKASLIFGDISIVVWWLCPSENLKVNVSSKMTGCGLIVQVPQHSSPLCDPPLHKWKRRCRIT